MNRFWNTTKTTLLLAGLTGFFVLVGGMLGGTTGMMFALVLAVGLNMAAWWFSDKVALRMSGAHEVTPEQAPELHRMVEVLANRAGNSQAAASTSSTVRRPTPLRRGVRRPRAPWPSPPASPVH